MYLINLCYVIIKRSDKRKDSRINDSDGIGKKMKNLMLPAWPIGGHVEFLILSSSAKAVISPVLEELWFRSSYIERAVQAFRVAEAL